MKIHFEQDTTNGYEAFFAVSKNVEKGKKFYDELLWAEIMEKDGRYTVVWEDDWQVRQSFPTLEEAKMHVMTEYPKHTARINGAEFELMD